MSSDTLLQKYNQLDPEARDHLLAFWDFLLTQSSRSSAVMSQTYREQIRQVGVWTEDDVQPLQEAASRWQWQASEW